jgi:hypothetical protein
VGGFVLSAGAHFVDGDDGATAVIKAGVETGAAALGAAAGAWAGGACAEAFIVCSPALTAVGGVFGGAIGSGLNDWADSDGGIFGWHPYEATDDWFNWD